MPCAPAVAILGTCRLAEHLAAIEALDKIRPNALGTSRFADPAQALSHPEVRGVVICTPLAEREYWVCQAAAAGKQVFCESPPAATFQRLQKMVDCCRRAGVELAVAAAELFSPFAREVCRLLGPGVIGAPLFFELRLAIPQRWLRDTREGLLLFHGLGYFSLLSGCFGPLDSVYARTRSLGLNRPEEDAAVAQLRFRNGIEGVVQLNGLGARGRVGLQVWGERGEREFEAELPFLPDQGLRLQYEDFIEVIERGTCPAASGARLLDSMGWVEWFQQSARLDREVFASEVSIG